MMKEKLIVLHARTVQIKELIPGKTIVYLEYFGVTNVKNLKLNTIGVINMREKMHKESKVSQPPFSQMRVKCPHCSYNNAMGIKHKILDEVLCANCGHWFIIGASKGNI